MISRSLATLLPLGADGSLCPVPGYVSRQTAGQDSWTLGSNCLGSVSKGKHRGLKHSLTEDERHDVAHTRVRTPACSLAPSQAAGYYHAGRSHSGVKARRGRKLSALETGRWILKEHCKTLTSDLGKSEIVPFQTRTQFLYFQVCNHLLPPHLRSFSFSCWLPKAWLRLLLGSPHQ